MARHPAVLFKQTSIEIWSNIKMTDELSTSFFFVARHKPFSFTKKLWCQILECHKLEGVKLTMYHLLTIMNVNFPCCLDRNRVCHQRRICKCQCRWDIGLISQNLFKSYMAIYLTYTLFLVYIESSSKIEHNYNFKTMACNFEIKSKSPCHKVYYFY